MNSNFDCRLDIPYPPVRVSAQNFAYAALLSRDLAGQVSEMTAVTSYVFQHMVIEDEALSNALACISRVEMKHYELLGHLITAFGGCPRLAVQSGCSLHYWSGQNISYEVNPAYFLPSNIKGELTAIAHYKERINQIDDPFAIKILERIILDEQNHIEIFNSFLSQVSDTCYI